MYRLRFRLFLACVLAFLSHHNSASAQISVNNVIVHFAAGQRPVQNVAVMNSSDNPMYVLVHVHEVKDPGGAKESVETTDLLASPKAFSVEPKGQRTVRLLLKASQSEAERVFRVGFVPQDRGFGEEIQRSAQGRNAVIRLLTGMGILVFVDPAAPKAELKWDRNGDKIVFTNTGNINLHLGDGKSCSPSGACTSLPSSRIYAGKSFEIKAPAENTVAYLQTEGGSDNYQKLSIPPVAH